MAPPSKAASLLLALAGLLLLVHAGAVAAKGAERKLLAQPILRPTDAAKQAAVDPLPAPPPGEPSQELPAPAEKCEAVVPPSQRTGPAPAPAEQEGSAPDTSGVANAKSTVPEPSRTAKCLSKQRAPTWEEWAVWLAANDEKLKTIFKCAWAGLGGGAPPDVGNRWARCGTPHPPDAPLCRPVVCADCRCSVRLVVASMSGGDCYDERETFCPSRPCAQPEVCPQEQLCLDGESALCAAAFSARGLHLPASGCSTRPADP